MAENPYDRYKTDVINTATPDQLVLMLFEAALRAAQECQDAIGREDWIQTVEHGRQVQDIMAYLADTVNLEHPHGEQVKQLYLYCWRNAVAAQIQHDRKVLEPVKTVLNNLISGLRSFLSHSQTPPNNEESKEHLSINFAG